MYDTGDITQDGEQDVDEEISIASALKENTKRREDNGEDDFADISVVETRWSARAPVAKSGKHRVRKGRKWTYDAVKGMMAVGLMSFGDEGDGMDCRVVIKSDGSTATGRTVYVMGLKFEEGRRGRHRQINEASII